MAYVDGGSETFALPNAHARREYLPGAYKTSAPVAPAPEPSPAPIADPDNGAPAELTPTGALRLRSDVAALVSKVLVLTNAENPPATEKFTATRTGNEWSTGRPLGDYPAAVYQIWFTSPPPADVPHHQAFPSPAGPAQVAHITQAGTFKPETTRNP